MPVHVDRRWAAVSVVSGLVIATTIAVALLGTPPPRSTRANIAPPMELLSLSDAAVMGATNAPIALVVFSDFQCPFCRSFARVTLPEIVATYVEPGMLRVVFRHLPLDGIHSDARRAAELADCARTHGRFWEFHDALFQDPKAFEGDWRSRVSASIGLPTGRTAQCGDGQSAERVQADSLLAMSLGIGTTPTILLGRVLDDERIRISRVLVGASSAAVIGREIDSLLLDSKAW